MYMNKRQCIKIYNKYFNCSDIALTAQKKKECNARAMKIVHLLIEGKFRKESFLACVCVLLYPLHKINYYHKF